MSESNPTSNRLATETSPYLLQHQHQPVDWMPWGEEALNRAINEDKPIFLSVGYSTCFWCHVMARESFAEPRIAELMNRSFVNVKLDREERPDLDEIYMSATQILTGQGGWPNSVFLTPKLLPFFAGTYFPPADRADLPGFPTVLNSLAEAWQSRRGEVEEQAKSLAEGMRRYLESELPEGAFTVEEVVQEAYRSLERSFDPRYGGFGGAPKFPSASNLLFLLEVASSTRSEASQAGSMLQKTLDGMARGGLFDQLGGGFHRYSTDEAWQVPHFEKMLYDNGLLLEVYALDWKRSGDELCRRTILSTADFIRRRMTCSGGAFASALDAETDGEEGAYYVWKREELSWALGEEDFGFLAPILGFAGPTQFAGGRYVLHHPASDQEQAARRRMSEPELRQAVDSLKARLLSARQERPGVAVDDKVLTDWNGTMIRGLAVAGRVLDEPQLVEQAATAARFLLEELRPQGRPLQHVARNGQVKVDALLGDYAFFVRGLLGLFDATQDDHWLAAAVDLTQEQVARLGDPEGGFFLAPLTADVVLRSRDAFDGALPSANAVAALNLVDLFRYTQEPRYRGWLDQSLARLGGLAAKAPAAMRTFVVALWRGAQLESAAELAEASSGVASVSEPEASAPLGPKDDGDTLSRVKCVESKFQWLGVDGSFELEVQLAPGWSLAASANPLEPPSLSLSVTGAEWDQEADCTPKGDSERAFVLRGRLAQVEAEAVLTLEHRLCDERQCWPRGRCRMVLPPLVFR